MTLKQKFQNEIETESTASLNMGDVLSWGVLIFGEGHGSRCGHTGCHRGTAPFLPSDLKSARGSATGDRRGAGIRLPLHSPFSRRQWANISLAHSSWFVSARI